MKSKPYHKPVFNTSQDIINIIRLISYIVVLLFSFLVFLLCRSYSFLQNSHSSIGKASLYKNNTSKPSKFIFTKETDTYWSPLDLKRVAGSALEAQILYGKDLIEHTSKYIGPKGSLAKLSNGMNCQNCHLEAGTKVFGNNYASVASTFPKFRARSGSVESIYKRVNDCIMRSLNGVPLDTFSTEMQAIKAYMLFLGKNVSKGTKVKGSGLKEIKFLDRAADPHKGKVIYVSKCTSCHKENGQGMHNITGDEYIYPPLWGKNSYNDAAGLYRLSNFAKFIKHNMPLGATYDIPILSDEEAWDVAAYINSQSRPHKNVPEDWPDISKKPVDHPFGPYRDNFTERQHKYGPFISMTDALKKK